MTQTLLPSESELRTIVEGFRPTERFVLTFKVCAGISEMEALAELAENKQLEVLPDTVLPVRDDTDEEWSSARARQRVIRILPAFKRQEFENTLGYSTIESIEPFSEN